MAWNLGRSSKWSSFSDWMDCLRAVWVRGRHWLRGGSAGPRQPIRTRPSFQPRVTQLEDRMAAGGDVSRIGMLAAVMGGAGMLLQPLVSALVAGPSPAGPETISLTETGARGDLASAAPPPDDFQPTFAPSEPAQVSYAQFPSPESPELFSHQTLDHYFATIGNSRALAEKDPLASPLDESAPANPHDGGGHKIDDGTGNGGGGHNGSDAPAVDAEGSADPVRGLMTSSAGSNYLTNSALATQLSGANVTSPCDPIAVH